MFFMDFIYFFTCVHKNKAFCEYWCERISEMASSSEQSDKDITNSQQSSKKG